MEVALLEIAIGIVVLLVLIAVLIRFARSHSRREQEALSALGEMVYERKAIKSDEETLVP